MRNIFREYYQYFDILRLAKIETTIKLKNLDKLDIKKIDKLLTKKVKKVEESIKIKGFRVTRFKFSASTASSSPRMVVKVKDRVIEDIMLKVDKKGLSFQEYRIFRDNSAIDNYLNVLKRSKVKKEISISGYPFMRDKPKFQIFLAVSVIEGALSGGIGIPFLLVADVKLKEDIGIDSLKNLIFEKLMKNQLNKVWIFDIKEESLEIYFSEELYSLMKFYKIFKQFKLV